MPATRYVLFACDSDDEAPSLALIPFDPADPASASMGLPKTAMCLRVCNNESPLVPPMRSSCCIRTNSVHEVLMTSQPRARS